MLADPPILDLPKLALKMRDLLPEYSGIYYVLDENQVIWYIGKAKNIRKRWQGKSHHRIYQLETQKKLSFYIYYEEVSITILDQKEKEQIAKYKPHLNESPVKTKQVRPTEELLKETILAINEFAFILGIEPPNNDIQLPKEIARKKSKNIAVIHICLDLELLMKKFNFQSYEEQEAIIKSSFHTRKIYASKWEAIPKKYPLIYRLYVNGYIVEYNYYLSSLIVKNRENFYFETLTIAKENVNVLATSSLEEIKQKIDSENRNDNYIYSVVKILQPYTIDPIKVFFQGSIDQEKAQKKLIQISEDYQSGRRGFGSRDSTRREKIQLFIQSFSFTPQTPLRVSKNNFDGGSYPVYNFAEGIKDGKQIRSASYHFKILYFLVNVDKEAWLLFQDYFQGFAKPACQLSEGESFISKLYVSSRKYVVPARAMINKDFLGYRTGIPFGFNPDFPTFEQATQEIRRRLQVSNLPNLKLSFKRESVSQ